MKKQIPKALLLKRARFLRKHNTDSEAILWYYLRGRHLESYKFKRQYPIEKFITDFVCLKKKLIIELDGSHHMESHQYDRNRTSILEAKGYRVLRFWNHDILLNIERVLEVILYELTNR